MTERAPFTPTQLRILAELEPLIRQAERERKWLVLQSFILGNQWYSPAQLRALHAKGEMIWSAVNWALRDPQERVDQAEAAVMAAKLDASRVRAEVEASK